MLQLIIIVLVGITLLAHVFLTHWLNLLMLNLVIAMKMMIIGYMDAHMKQQQIIMLKQHLMMEAVNLCGEMSIMMEYSLLMI
mgnify:CR=1 FL=1